MSKMDVIYVEKKSSPLKSFLKFVLVVGAIAAVCFAVYKYIDKKYRSKILGRIDLDGDGEAIMLDTTGNGEIDTIILDADEE